RGAGHHAGPGGGAPVRGAGGVDAARPGGGRVRRSGRRLGRRAVRRGVRAVADGAGGGGREGRRDGGGRLRDAAAPGRPAGGADDRPRGRARGGDGGRGGGGAGPPGGVKRRAHGRRPAAFRRRPGRSPLGAAPPHRLGDGGQDDRQDHAQ